MTARDIMLHDPECIAFVGGCLVLTQLTEDGIVWNYTALDFPARCRLVNRRICSGYLIGYDNCGLSKDSCEWTTLTADRAIRLKIKNALMKLFASNDLSYRKGILWKVI